jgi:hypothetical protein
MDTVHRDKKVVGVFVRFRAPLRDGRRRIQTVCVRFFDPYPLQQQQQKATATTTTAILMSMMVGNVVVNVNHDEVLSEEQRRETRTITKH